IPPAPQNQSEKLYTRSIRRALGRFILFHVPAVGITLGLLVIYTNQLSWNASADQLAGLLFVAKVHEALIIASLFDIVYYNICCALLSRRGVPFGYLTAAFQLNSPFYFLSREFWAPMTSLRSTTASSFGIALLLLLSFLIASLASASSGVIMLPKLGWWQFQELIGDARGNLLGLVGTVVSPADAMFPTRVDMGTVHKVCLGPSSGDYSSICPFGDLLDPADGIYTSVAALEQIRFTTAIVNVSLSLSRSRSALVRYDIQFDNFVAATCPLALVDDLLIGLIYDPTNAPVKITPRLSDRDGKVVDLKQPRVVVQCSTDMASPLIHHSLFNGTVSYNFHMARSYYPETNFTLDRELFRSTLDSGAPFGLLDLNPHLPFQTSGVIWAKHWNSYVGYYDLGVCLVDARWVKSDTFIIPAQNPTSTQHSVSLSKNKTLDYTNQDPTDLISIDPAWFNLLNVSLVDLDGRQNYSFNKIKTTIDPDLVRGDNNVHQAIAGSLAVFLADALSYVPYGHDQEVTRQSEKEPWIAHESNPPFKPIQMDDLPDYILLTADATKNIYAYNFSETTTLLSWAVLFVHLLLVVVHLSIVFFFRRSWYTDAWSSLGQVVALAMDSRPTGGLIGDDGAMVNKGATWKLLAFVPDTADSPDGRVGIVLTDPKGGEQVNDAEVQRRLIPRTKLPPFKFLS
ncbi:hypothetical protein QBC37DRAFT_295576, partial [Rhypophila decipiens]